MRVMIVDDSTSMRLIIKRTLKQAGYDDMEILEAVDGADALAKVDDYNPHLILCDWNMPNMTGIEFLQKIRAAENAVKFGFVTTESTTEMRDAAKEAGAQFLIAKPFTAESFSTALKPVIGPVSGYRTPSAEALNRVLEMIVGDYASAKADPASALEASHRAIYLDRADATVASCRCDIAAAAGLACALSMIPPGGCEDMVASKELTANAGANLNEVMNIFSNLFMDDRSAHLRLSGLGTDVAGEVPETGTDTVFTLDLGRYGKGLIAFRHV